MQAVGGTAAVLLQQHQVSSAVGEATQQALDWQLGQPASSAFACAVRRLRIGDDAVAAFKVHSHAEDLEEQFGGGPLA